ncbi:MAG: ATP-binding protein [Candidatus Omnitrophica bacterium]|nr:ATP-binding protein [Candidatus Omnitrophota bacterium]
MFNRDLLKEVQLAAKEYPVITITGPRQSGKTTLAQMAFAKKAYVNLEEPQNRRFAIDDPRGFLGQYPDGVIIDEAHKAPDIFSYIQVSADKLKKNGHYILTGSHHFLLLEAVSQSLAGRAAIYHLLPLGFDELKKAKVFPSSLDELIRAGAYPKVYAQKLNAYKWYGNYVNTYLERDVRAMKQVSDLMIFQRFMKLVAARSGTILNYASIANDLGVSANTVKGWVSILEASFIVFLLAVYHRNFNKRLVKSPKIYFYDTGLLSYLLDIQNDAVLDVHPLKGQIFETLIVSELMKQYYHHGRRPRLYFWRDKTGHEIDCVMEKGMEAIPLEIKSGRTINSSCFDNLDYWKRLNKTNLSYLVYAGETAHQRHECSILPYDQTTGIINSIARRPDGHDLSNFASGGYPGRV